MFEVFEGLVDTSSFLLHLSNSVDHLIVMTMMMMIFAMTMMNDDDDDLTMTMMTVTIGSIQR